MTTLNTYENPKTYQPYTDTSFVTGDSPQDHDVNTDLGRNAIQGFIDNHGPGALQYALSADGATFLGNAYLPAGARDNLKGDTGGGKGEGIDTIRIVWVADTAYSIKVK